MRVLVALPWRELRPEEQREVRQQYDGLPEGLYARLDWERLPDGRWSAYEEDLTALRVREQARLQERARETAASPVFGLPYGAAREKREGVARVATLQTMSEGYEEEMTRWHRCVEDALSRMPGWTATPDFVSEVGSEGPMLAALEWTRQHEGCALVVRNVENTVSAYLTRDALPERRFPAYHTAVYRDGELHPPVRTDTP